MWSGVPALRRASDRESSSWSRRGPPWSVQRGRFLPRNARRAQRSVSLDPGLSGLRVSSRERRGTEK